MNTKHTSFMNRAGLALCAASLLAGGRLAAAEKAEADAFPNHETYIKVTGQGAAISGNKAAFQNRTRQDGDGAVGIEDLHATKEISKTTTLTIDGHALMGAEDYLGQFNLTKNEVGSIEAGYKRFRTFYDGVGGFFPLNSQWMPLQNEDLHIDRSRFWVEAKVNLPSAPVFTLRYTNELRNGRKDSTIWGDTDFTGLPNNVSPISQVRKLVPSYLNIGERHEAIEASMRKTVKHTTVFVQLMGDRTNNLNTRFVTRFPGEAKPFPTPATTVLLPAAQMNNQVVLNTTDGIKTQTSGALAEVDTELNSKVTLKVAGNYELVYADYTGDRTITTSTPTATGVVPITTNNNKNLVGGSHVKELVGSIALELKPTKAFTATVGVKGMDEYARGTSNYDVIAASGTPAITLATTPRFAWSKAHEKEITPVVDVRYSGIKNVAIYGAFSKADVSGTESNSSAFNPLTATSGTFAANNVSKQHENYKLGVSWKQSTNATLRAELFSKNRKLDSAGYGLRVGDYYLLDAQDSGVKLTALIRLNETLSTTTRYVYQDSEMQVTGYLPTYPAYDSLKGKNHMIGETIDWNPNKTTYVQLNGNWVFNVINTIYPRAGITVATATAIAFDTNRVLQNSDNNYSTYSLVSGVALDKRTDGQLLVTYYRADNNNAALAPLTLPYGVDVEDFTATVGVKYKVSEKILLRAKVGYFDSKNNTTGGRTNYHGPVGYVSFEHAL